MHFTEDAEVRRALADDEKLVDPRRYLGPGRDAVRAEVERLLVLLAGEGWSALGTG